MRCGFWVLLVVMAGVAATGCGSAGDANEGATPVASVPDSSEGTPDTPDAPKLEGPAAAVFEFLEAVRTGNDSKADKMLTALARKKTAEMNMVVAPPGSDTARFEVGKAEVLSDGRAQVTCKWSDRDGDDQVRTDEITWLLRQEPEGWRVGGMAAVVFPGERPVLLNFEDPEDMLRQQQSLQEEMRRRTATAPTQAQRLQSPEKPDEPLRR